MNKIFTYQKASRKDQQEIDKLHSLYFNQDDPNFDFQILLKDNSNLFRVIKDETNKVLAYLYSHQVLNECEIYQICVDSKYKHKGIGTFLLNEFIKECEYIFVNSIFLEVRVSNKFAIGLYKKCGFKDLYIRKQYYYDNEDALILKLEVQKDFD